MKIIEKISAKNADNYGMPVTIAFLGDSVTHGCFDCYTNEKGQVDTYFDASSAYPTRLWEMMHLLYPAAQINVVNSGISGDNTYRGRRRFERDVAKYSPDLVVVSYGLNDSTGGISKLGEYKDNLAEIFDKVAATGAECIFLTQNMMCIKVSCHLSEENHRAAAENLARVQNDGVLKAYFDGAKEVAAAHDVKVCDIYSAWETMAKAGVDTTELLANRLNHPIEKMHFYTAIKLIETMFE
ncbi:MAG: GDSL family lipase [Clostridia bacterium]|nr:GDSL family lipase [Clostridia bacterium]